MAVPALAQIIPVGRTGALDTLPPPSEIATSLQPDLAAPEVPDNYVLGPDDLISIFVYQMPELTSQVRIDGNGAIRLPMLPSAIKASGLTTPQLASDISRQLLAQGLARSPVVQVIVRQVMSRPIVISGAVRYPTVLQAARPMRLDEALARAGGIEADSGTRILLSTGTGADRQGREIDLNELLNSTSVADDPWLSGGEVVRVLQARMIYVTGALLKPGAFPLRTGEPITVLKALALAEGFSTTSPPDRKHAEIIRTVKGDRQVIPVNLDRILKHRDPNVEMQAGDLLYVPESGRSKVMSTALNDVAQTAVIALGYNATHIF